MLERTLIVACSIASLTAFGCGDDEPSSPPSITAAEITCADRDGFENQVVDEVLVTISDPERDLLAVSIGGTLNSVPMDEFDDPDGDGRFGWSPPGDFDPPIICEGNFVVFVEAADADGNIAQATFDVQK
jgi:hypothetical protein